MNVRGVDRLVVANLVLHHAAVAGPSSLTLALQGTYALSRCTIASRCWILCCDIRGAR